jgi:hypothetical protein
MSFAILCRKRLHQQGQPLSSSALYTLFLAGLTLLYTVYLKPSLLPPKEVFASVRAFSNTLFSYSQQLKTAEPLHNIFEELSLHCLERMNSRPDEKVVAQNYNGMQNPVAVQEKSAPEDWQEALFGTTKEISESNAIHLWPASLPDELMDLYATCRHSNGRRVRKVRRLQADDRDLSVKSFY